MSASRVPSLNLLQYADGFKDGGGGFNALVSGLGARAFDGLLDVVRGQQAEAHRHAAFKGHMGKALGGFGRHEIKMRRPAPDDGTDGDDAVILASFLQARGISKAPGTRTMVRFSSDPP